MITETIIFLSYMFICAALFRRRFSGTATITAFGIMTAVIALVQTALIMSGETTLALTLLPLTAYLPFSVLMYFLSEGGISETAAVCSIGMLDVLILKLLQKITVGLLALSDGYVYEITTFAVIVAAAAGLIFTAFKFIGKSFRFCVTENSRNGLLLAVPSVLIFLLISYFLNSTTDIIVLIFTMCIALLVFLIIAKMLISSSELIKVSRSEKELSDLMEIQRREYDRLLQKFDSGRVYRHDMRHHLKIIEGLAKQGDCQKIIEYAGKLNNSFDSLGNVSYCKIPEINAVLSEYVSRAENAGCKVELNIVLPESIPFQEYDVCIVLANSIENAINACLKLPREQRYINISAEYPDGKKLLVSVRNPCAKPFSLNLSGSPAFDRTSEEHGIGLCSVDRITSKYNGFLRCNFENGEFVFQAALFCAEDSNSQDNMNEKHESVPKRAMSSLLCLGTGALITINLFPSVAEAASSILPADIRTVRDFYIGWGDNSIKENYPEFGSDELNNAVNDYIRDARKKFLLYLNRKYNGYVAEDTRYTVIRDDGRYFIAQFITTINVGGSMDFSRWIVFDKSLGKVLSLADMFKDGSDYIGVISAEIIAQMRFRNENEGAGFFVSDGGTDEDCFTEISGDANFYINNDDKLVIVFDEYEVAPGFMGCPEFIIPDEVLKEIAR